MDRIIINLLVFVNKWFKNEDSSRFIHHCFVAARGIQSGSRRSVWNIYAGEKAIGEKGLSPGVG